MIRKTLTKKIQENNKEFRLRGHDVKRIEAFSDAVFALAVTLLIVSLEVPKNFEELLVTMKGFFAFGVSFTILVLIWYEQNVFFRRYALHDTVTITLNAGLIFIVLFYVYPLKFVFSLMLNRADRSLQIEQQQVPLLLFIYGAGYAISYLFFFCMYAHAYKKRELLQLTQTERFDTKTKMWSQSIHVSVSILTMISAFAIPVEQSGRAGYVYFLIGPALTFFYSLRGRKRREVFDEHAAASL